MSTSSSPMVSVILLTYNHEKFVRQALDSIESQRVNFETELIISEDCSTDATRSVIDTFLKEYKGKVTLLYSDVNLHSAFVGTRALDAASGKYVAYLDGDDYWASDYKLQRQVEFMELHPDCALSHHDVARVDPSGAVLRLMPGVQRTATIDDLIEGNFIQSCSSMIRRSAVERLPDWLVGLPVLDWPLYMLAAEHGTIGWIEGVLAHYRIHDGSVWATTTLARQWAGSIALLEVLEAHFGEGRRSAFAASRANLVRQLQDALAHDEGRGVGEMVARERELAAVERAETAVAASRSAAAEAEQRALMALGREAAALALVVQKEHHTLQLQYQFSQQEQRYVEREQQLQRQHADWVRRSDDERMVWRGETDRLVALLSENSHLLRRERRTGRRLLGIGVALLAVLSVAVMWLAFVS
ncbi:hypothetical protein C3941_03590 [Kaistia algarum]|uniref:glycosyltransferase n=1 Tax=Kaistia algarum TaxID=2083279 RepID=UPI000CE84BDE|nr:glycosyltransferase [Kaistia algarum]MCX5512704.1 glycosyltransferase [Kaistia algarum]PPE81788.1 hypothetical protein C3941_03590 [Kaistia algarum]